MISQLFVLSPRGDVLINRDFRGDLVRDAPEIFFRAVKLARDDHPPVFSTDDFCCIFVQRNALYFVAATRHNVSPLFVMEFLEQFFTAVKDFCGAVSEDTLRKNFALVYELIDEMVDFGYPQMTSTDQLRNYVASEPDGQQRLTMPKLPLFAGNTIRVDAAANPIANAKNRNEVFIDVVENLVVFFNASNTVVNSYLDGQMLFKSYLTGSPRLRVALNNDFSYDDAWFHECVTEGDFAAEKTLNLCPPVGEFKGLGYRVTKDFLIPVKLHSFFTQESPFKVSLLVKLDTLYLRELIAKTLVVRFSLPDSASTTFCEVVSSAKGQKTSHTVGKKEVEWRIEQMPGESDCSLDTRITLSKEMSMYNFRKEVGPIKLSFEINQLNCSRLKIKHIEIEGTGKENPNKWIRYITRSNSYVFRT